MNAARRITVDVKAKNEFENEFECKAYGHLDQFFSRVPPNQRKAFLVERQM